MDKKMVCGVLLSIMGFVISAFCFIYAILNPCIYHGIEGLLGSMLGTYTLIPFVVSSVVMILGLAICFRTAFKKEK
ncbi:MAG: hypothetical protein ACI4JX_00240 [Oscillospiraceae bacterium]